MRSIYIAISTIATVALSSLILGDGATVDDLYAFSSSLSTSSSLSSLPIEDNIQSPDTAHKRAITFKPYSHAYSQDNSVQWIFGNTTNLNNISFSKCIGLRDQLGIYQFDNGSTTYNATLLDVTEDLGVGTTNGTQARYAARTLSNALVTQSEVSAYLNEVVLASDSSPAPTLHRRVQFKSDGRILALAVKTAYGLLIGMGAAEVANTFNATKGQLAAGAVTTAGLILVYNIIDIITQDGGLTALEPAWMESTAAWIANGFMSMLRRVVMLARGAPDNGQAPLTNVEVTDYLDQMEGMSAWDTETTPLTASSLGIQGMQGLQCDQSPV